MEIIRQSITKPSAVHQSHVLFCLIDKNFLHLTCSFLIKSWSKNGKLPDIKSRKAHHSLIYLFLFQLCYYFLFNLNLFCRLYNGLGVFLNININDLSKWNIQDLIYIFCYLRCSIYNIYVYHFLQLKFLYLLKKVLFPKHFSFKLMNSSL